MSPVGLSPASSSSTLWAQPSKEWVIPAKPKPGRKPKKSETTTDAVGLKDDVDEESSSSRRVQNRQDQKAAQRAFRERKQTQLVELQARLHSYEQGEIERNVALQSIAKKMKEENEELRKENQTLREKIVRLEQDLADKDKKRAHDDTPTSSPSLPPADISARKRARVAEEVQEIHPPTTLPTFSLSPSSLASSPEDATALVGFLAPGGHETHSRHGIFPIPPSIDDILPPTTTTNDTFNEQVPVFPDSCILCRPDVPCVCKEGAIQQVTNDSDESLRQLSFQSENVVDKSAMPLPQSGHFDASLVVGRSTRPAFQAPVPIRRRTGPSRTNSIFPVTPIDAVSSLASKCSGDPDNCMACADDNFGKAFCQAIGHTMNTTPPCIDCPKRTNQTDEILVSGCCGDISKCGSCGIAPMISSTGPQRGPETMPTDDAWRQLKSHPNVAFADLTLLAEVVARRSKCTGSRVVLSPAPGSDAPDHSARLSIHESPASGEPSTLLGDHLGQFDRQRERESPPQLVPQHVLIECGRRRVREVNADGVREALRLLDQKFAHMR